MGLWWAFCALQFAWWYRWIGPFDEANSYSRPNSARNFQLVGLKNAWLTIFGRQISNREKKLASARLILGLICELCRPLRRGIDDSRNGKMDTQSLEWGDRILRSAFGGNPTKQCKALNAKRCCIFSSWKNNQKAIACIHQQRLRQTQALRGKGLGLIEETPNLD